MLLFRERLVQLSFLWMNVLNSVSDEKVEDLFPETCVIWSPTRFSNSCGERERARERERDCNKYFLLHVSCVHHNCEKACRSSLCSCEKFVLVFLIPKNELRAEDEPLFHRTQLMGFRKSAIS
jgi:hypothetical protein